MLKKTWFSYKLQSSLLEQETDHDEIYEDTWEGKKHEWLPYLKKMCYQLLSLMLSVQRYRKDNRIWDEK